MPCVVSWFRNGEPDANGGRAVLGAHYRHDSPEAFEKVRLVLPNAMPNQAFMMQLATR